MNRRKYLTAVCAATASLSGCLRSELPPSLVSPRNVSVESVTSTLSERFGVEVDVTMAESSMTDAHPAAVKRTFRNESYEKRTLTYIGPTVGLWDSPHGSADSTLLLVSSPDHWSRKYDCWSKKGPVSIPKRPNQTVTIELPPQTQKHIVYELWDVSGDEPCMPPGTYDFSRIYGSPHAGDNLETATLEGTTASLEFTLRLKSA